MPAIDHLSLGVPEIATARTFYDSTLGTLGCEGGRLQFGRADPAGV